MADYGRDAIYRLQLTTAGRFRTTAAVEGDTPLAVLPVGGTSYAGLLADFTCVPHEEWVRKESPIEGVKPARLDSPPRPRKSIMGYLTAM